MLRIVSQLMKPKGGILASAFLLILLALMSASRTPAPVAASSTGPSFVEFESGPVRPIAMSSDGTLLFAVNTPNGTLEIFNITPAGPVFQSRVPVGMEPVAVAARNNNELWVVNHLSDSVSIVSLTGAPHVTRTLLVADDTRDIISAGSPPPAFIPTPPHPQRRA